MKTPNTSDKLDEDEARGLLNEDDEATDLLNDYTDEAGNLPFLFFVVRKSFFAPKIIFVYL